MEYKKILVRAANWLGDAVLSLPALRALRARYPQAHLAVLARPGVADLHRRESCCDEVIACEKRRTWRTARALRGQGFDCAILLPNSFEAALTVWLARIPQRIGYDRDRRGWLLTAALPPPRAGEIPPHERYYYLELLRRAGIVGELPEADAILLERREEARRAGEELFRQMGVERPVIGISPGAQNSRAKRWMPEAFAEAAAQLASRLGAAVALFGSEAERDLAQVIAEQVRRAGLPILNLAGETSLERFLELAAACRVFVTNDSGAMHAAAAAGVPTVAVFGPTIVEATGPVSPRARVVREPVECSPCMLRDCPIDHRCMRRIAPERVAQTALELLK
ncbi:MAG: lipopolysaccharide heptosyltransferase II [Acidobacteria bacterium]|nr:lipopolysaccharide heptosyltransferase II [Acidobacteriota bacterium]